MWNNVQNRKNSDYAFLMVGFLDNGVQNFICMNMKL